MLAWASAAALVLADPGPKDVRKPATAPTGEWAVERIELLGNAWTIKDWLVLRVTSGGVVLLGIGTEEEQPAAFYNAGGVLEVDIDPGDPKRVRRGIWKVDGDTLTICESNSGRPRPTEFKADRMAGHTLWVLKRAAKK